MASTSAIAVSRAFRAAAVSSRARASSAAQRAGRLGRLRDRAGIGQLPPGPPEVLEQRRGRVQLAGQPLLVGGGRLDQLAVFREPGAAAAGPVGGADVLRGRLRPGAGVDAVA